MDEMNNQLPGDIPDSLMSMGGPDLVYIRSVSAADVSNMPGLEDIAEDARLYAVMAADGRYMAVMDDRETAFTMARQNELNPVSVH